MKNILKYNKKPRQLQKKIILQNLLSKRRTEKKEERNKEKIRGR